MNRPISLRPLALVFAVVCCAVFLVAPTALADCKAKPLVVKIHADWCGSCRATQPTWDRVVADLADQATLVEFDVTDRASYAVAVEKAERLDISDFLEEFRRRTGTIAVLDCRTKKPVILLTGERDFEKYRKAIQEANEPS